jgi:hypothetical protein
MRKFYSYFGDGFCLEVSPTSSSFQVKSTIMEGNHPFETLSYHETEKKAFRFVKANHNVDKNQFTFILQ